MTLETGLLFFVSLLLLWIKPGPGQALKVTRALNDGFMPAFYVVLGVITACQIFFLSAVFGLVFISEIFAQTGFFLKLIGAIYLLYLGYKGLSNIEKGVWQGRLDKSQKRHFWENYPAALMLTLANPLPIFYFLGMMPTLVPLGDFAMQDVVMGMIIIFCAGFLVDTMLIGLVTQSKEALSNSNFVKKINIFTSMGFILIGAFFLYSAFFLSDYQFDMGLG
jgi:threonine/homoserine/homoserine lactone efflux protein